MTLTVEIILVQNMETCARVLQFLATNMVDSTLTLRLSYDLVVSLKVFLTFLSTLASGFPNLDFRTK